MKEEKEELRDLEVLDEGIEAEAIIGPNSACCGSLFIPFLY